MSHNHRRQDRVETEDSLSTGRSRKRLKYSGHNDKWALGGREEYMRTEEEKQEQRQTWTVGSVGLARLQISSVLHKAVWTHVHNYITWGSSEVSLAELLLMIQQRHVLCPVLPWRQCPTNMFRDSVCAGTRSLTPTWMRLIPSPSCTLFYFTILHCN